LNSAGKIDFLIDKFAVRVNCVAFAETNYFKKDMYKSESSQIQESRGQSSYSSKACSKRRAFNCCQWKLFHIF